MKHFQQIKLQVALRQNEVTQLPYPYRQPFNFGYGKCGTLRYAATQRQLSLHYWTQRQIHA